MTNLRKRNIIIQIEYVAFLPAEESHAA